LRRNLPAFDVQFAKLLFKAGSIVDLAKGKVPAGNDGKGLGLGNLK